VSGFAQVKVAHGGSLDLVQPLGAYLFTNSDEDTITQMLRHELLGHDFPGQGRSRGTTSKPKKQHTNFKNLKGFTTVNALFKANAVCAATHAICVCSCVCLLSLIVQKCHSQ
jgi:hypothetical protein